MLIGDSSGILTGRFRAWKAKSNGGALGRPSHDIDLTTEELSTFSHPEQSKGVRVGDLLLRNALAIILDFEQERARLFFEPNGDLGSTGVASDIGERLLTNAEHHRRPFPIHDNVLLARHAATDDPASAFEVLSLPFNCRHEAEVIQHGRPQFRDNPLHGLNGGIDVFYHGSYLAVGFS